MPGFDITEGIILDLSTPIATAYLPSDAAWDCAIGGLPFMFAIDKERPYTRQTADYRRQRVDQERDPGEQSLDSGLWLRSTSSLHYGAGLQSSEDAEVDAAIARFRFWKSASVDVWTPGQVTLGVARPDTYSNSSSTYYVLGINDTTMLTAAGSALSTLTKTGTSTAITWGGAGTIQSITADGTNYYAANAGGVYKGTLAGGAGSKIWDTGGTTIVRWVKQRLMASVGSNLYELTGTGPTLPTALYSHPNTSWTWTDIAEGPTSIYFSGYAGPQSSIYRSSISASGATVTIGAPIVVAEMPRGEKVLSIYDYLGSYLAIGTSRGLRIAAIQSDGSLQVGPLIFQCSEGVYDAVGYDKYLFVTGGSDTTGLNGATGPGIYRVDLSQEVDSLRFAYAQEIAETSGTAPLSVTMVGTDFVYTLTTGVKLPNASTPYASQGWVEYGKVNFSTGEYKDWRSVVVRGDTPAGTSIEVFASSTGTGAPGTWGLVGTLSSSATDGEFSLGVAAPQPTRDMWLAVRLVGSGTARPTLYSVTLRAVPAPKKTRLIQVPLMCFDYETDRYGQRLGYEGGSWARLSALENAEDLGRSVTWQDFTTGERRQATIEQVVKSRVTPPSRSNSNDGGVVTVVLRLL